MDNNKNINYLIESSVDNYIDNIILQEIKLSSLNPKILKNYTDEVINNSFKTMIKGISTILVGGAIGGSVNVLIRLSKIISDAKDYVKSLEVLKTMTSNIQKALPGNQPVEVGQGKEGLSLLIELVKEKFIQQGPGVATAGIFTGISLSLVYMLLMSKYKLSKKEAKNKTINMAKKASLKADKKTKDIINGTIQEFKKIT
ncbi:MAG: hypothetical protein ACOC1K_01180 [Nanoarchaeota archaeon]